MMTETQAEASRGPVSGFAKLILATAFAGIAGYLITWLIPRQIGFESYAVFAIFWSMLFLVISALSGIQQEVTRATAPAVASSAGDFRRTWAFGFGAALLAFAVLMLTGLLWAGPVFGDAGWALVWPLAVGASSYVLVAVLGGTLYGLSSWGAIFSLICIEAALRLVAVGIALVFTSNVIILAWMTAIPFALTLLLIWPFVRNGRVGKPKLDVGYGQLTRNISRTIFAAASMGIMVSGFPFLMGVTSAGAPPEVLSLLILAITLTRAPLIVVMMALQSYLIIYFREHAQTLWRSLFMILGAIAVAAATLALLGNWIGPAVFELLFPGEIVPDGGLIAVLVASSGLMGALCVTAPAVLAGSQHTLYTAGWLGAAIATIGCLLLPLDLHSRTVLALMIGPLAGLMIHGTALFWKWRVGSISDSAA